MHFGDYLTDFHSQFAVSNNTHPALLPLLSDSHLHLDALGIYLLNLLLAFLQPKFDPSLEADLQADEIEEGLDAIPSLPSQKDDEFRPFVRRLPEWNFWLSSTRSISIAIFCSLFTAFDVPVYWPILVLYFCILFALTMRRQIQCVVATFSLLPTLTRGVISDT